MRATVFQSQAEIHYNIFPQSLKLMSGTLERDMYGLISLGFPIDKVKVPAHDPLATTRCSCIYWVDHLNDAVLSKSTKRDESLGDGSALYVFLTDRYLY